LFIFLGGFMNKESILALLRQNPKLAEVKSVAGTHKIADAYLNQVGGGLCNSNFASSTTGGKFTSTFAQAGCQ
jgi:hypothetical protein